MATRFDDFKPYVNVVIRNWKEQQKASANRIPFHMKASHLDTDEDKLQSKLGVFEKIHNQIKRGNLMNEALMKHKFNIPINEQLDVLDYDALKTKLLQLNKVASMEEQLTGDVSDDLKSRINETQTVLGMRLKPAGVKRIEQMAGISSSVSMEVPEAPIESTEIHKLVKHSGLNETDQMELITFLSGSGSSEGFYKKGSMWNFFTPVDKSKTIKAKREKVISILREKQLKGGGSSSRGSIPIIPSSPFATPSPPPKADKSRSGRRHVPYMVHSDNIVNKPIQSYPISHLGVTLNQTNPVNKPIN